MKALLLSLPVLFLCAARALAQYHPTAVEGAHWLVFALSDEGPDHHAYVIKGDTTVGINTYKKVYRRKINSDATILADFMPPYYFSDEKLIGAIRDDLPEKTVYGIGFVADAWYLDTCDVLEEQLLYDYSVSVGEEVIGCLNTADALPNAVVDSIKTEIHFGVHRAIPERCQNQHSGFGWESLRDPEHRGLVRKCSF